MIYLIDPTTIQPKCTDKYVVPLYGVYCYVYAEPI